MNNTNAVDYLADQLQKSRTNGTTNTPNRLDPQNTPVNLDSLANKYGINPNARQALGNMIGAMQTRVQIYSQQEVEELANAKGFLSKAAGKFVEDLPGNLVGMAAHQIADRGVDAIGMAAGPLAAFTVGTITGGVKAYMEYNKYEGKEAEFYQKKVAQKDRRKREVNAMASGTFKEKLKKGVAQGVNVLKTVTSGLPSFTVEKGFKVKQRDQAIKNELSLLNPPITLGPNGFESNGQPADNLLFLALDDLRNRDPLGFRNLMRGVLVQSALSGFSEQETRAQINAMFDLVYVMYLVLGNPADIVAIFDEAKKEVNDYYKNTKSEYVIASGLNTGIRNAVTTGVGSWVVDKIRGGSPAEFVRNQFSQPGGTTDIAGVKVLTQNNVDKFDKHITDLQNQINTLRSGGNINVLNNVGGNLDRDSLMNQYLSDAAHKALGKSATVQQYIEQYGGAAGERAIRVQALFDIAEKYQTDPTIKALIDKYPGDPVKTLEALAGRAKFDGFDPNNIAGYVSKQLSGAGGSIEQARSIFENGTLADGWRKLAEAAMKGGQSAASHTTTIINGLPVNDQIAVLQSQIDGWDAAKKAAWDQFENIRVNAANINVMDMNQVVDFTARLNTSEAAVYAGTILETGMFAAANAAIEGSDKMQFGQQDNAVTPIGGGLPGLGAPGVNPNNVGGLGAGPVGGLNAGPIGGLNAGPIGGIGQGNTNQNPVPNPINGAPNQPNVILGNPPGGGVNGQQVIIGQPPANTFNGGTTAQGALNQVIPQLGSGLDQNTQQNVTNQRLLDQIDQLMGAPIDRIDFINYLSGTSTQVINFPPTTDPIMGRFAGAFILPETYMEDGDVMFINNGITAVDVDRVVVVNPQKDRIQEDLIVWQIGDQFIAESNGEFYEILRNGKDRIRKLDNNVLELKNGKKIKLDIKDKKLKVESYKEDLKQKIKLIKVIGPKGEIFLSRDNSIEIPNSSNGKIKTRIILDSRKNTVENSYAAEIGGKNFAVIDGRLFVEINGKLTEAYKDNGQVQIDDEGYRVELKNDEIVLVKIIEQGLKILPNYVKRPPKTKEIFTTSEGILEGLSNTLREETIVIESTSNNSIKIESLPINEEEKALLLGKESLWFDELVPNNPKLFQEGYDRTFDFQYQNNGEVITNALAVSGYEVTPPNQLNLMDFISNPEKLNIDAIEEKLRKENNWIGSKKENIEAITKYLFHLVHHIELILGGDFAVRNMLLSLDKSAGVDIDIFIDDETSPNGIQFEGTTDISKLKFEQKNFIGGRVTRLFDEAEKLNSNIDPNNPEANKYVFGDDGELFLNSMLRIAGNTTSNSITLFELMDIIENVDHEHLYNLMRDGGWNKYGNEDGAEEKYKQDLGLMIWNLGFAIDSQLHEVKIETEPIDPLVEKGKEKLVRLISSIKDVTPTEYREGDLERVVFEVVGYNGGPSEHILVGIFLDAIKEEGKLEELVNKIVDALNLQSDEDKNSSRKGIYEFINEYVLTSGVYTGGEQAITILKEEVTDRIKINKADIKNAADRLRNDMDDDVEEGEYTESTQLQSDKLLLPDRVEGGETIDSVDNRRPEEVGNINGREYVEQNIREKIPQSIELGQTISLNLDLSENLNQSMDIIVDGSKDAKLNLYTETFVNKGRVLVIQKEYKDRQRRLGELIEPDSVGPLKIKDGSDYDVITDFKQKLNNDGTIQSIELKITILSKTTLEPVQSNESTSGETPDPVIELGPSSTNSLNADRIEPIPSGYIIDTSLPSNALIDHLVSDLGRLRGEEFNQRINQIAQADLTQEQSYNLLVNLIALGMRNTAYGNMYGYEESRKDSITRQPYTLIFKNEVVNNLFNQLLNRMNVPRDGDSRDLIINDLRNIGFRLAHNPTAGLSRRDIKFDTPDEWENWHKLMAEMLYQYPDETSYENNLITNFFSGFTRFVDIEYVMELINQQARLRNRAEMFIDLFGSRGLGWVNDDILDLTQQIQENPYRRRRPHSKTELEAIIKEAEAFKSGAGRLTEFSIVVPKELQVDGPEILIIRRVGGELRWFLGKPNTMIEAVPVNPRERYKLGNE